MIPEIHVSDLVPLVASGARVIDVRETDEYIAGHVPGAISIPLSTVPERIDEFRFSGDTYVICQAGSRSMRACQYLADFDINNLINIAGGTAGWAADGNELDVGA